MVAGVADAVAAVVARVVAEAAAAAAVVAVETSAETSAEVAFAAEEFADVVVVEVLILDPNLDALAEGMLEALIAYVNP